MFSGVKLIHMPFPFRWRACRLVLGDSPTPAQVETIRGIWRLVSDHFGIDTAALSAPIQEALAA